MAGELSLESRKQAEAIVEKLIQRTKASHAGVFVETVIAPSMKTALAQVVQVPGISGLPNNSILFEFPQNEAEEIKEVIEGARLISPLNYNICILRSSEFRFGYRKNIHI